MLLQIFWVKDFAYYNVAFCFIYIGFLISLPVATNVLLYLVLAFLTGMVIDSFYNSPGLHAAASVFAVYVRKPLIRLLTPLGGYSNDGSIALAQMGVQWYMAYTGLLVFVHHFLLFIIEAGTWNYWWYTLLKIVFSTLLTTFFIVSAQYLLPLSIGKK